jgi:aspartate/glutamate racemase
MSQADVTLSELRSAASFLENKGARLVLFKAQTGHAADDEIDSSYDLMPEDIVAAAKEHGWVP